MNAETALVPHDPRPVDIYRMSTDAASVCRDIVIASATTIQGRSFVSVEGWQAIAIAHGCAAGARDVERVEGGVRAIGEVRRMSDGQLIAQAEGFVGEDETTWYGGTDKRGKKHDKRNDYAIRAMAQTRAISRACRSAFAHVVVMMKAGLSTTPAEEVPHEGFDRDTGEIIEGTVSNGPAPRTKLDGPHTSKTALKNAVQAIDGRLRKAESVSEVNAILKEERATIEQAARDWPELVNGAPNIDGAEGLRGLAARRRTELTPPEASDLFKSLVESLNECDDETAMKALVNVRGDSIGDLDGEESRKFEALYDERFAIIKSGKVPLVPAE